MNASAYNLCVDLDKIAMRYVDEYFEGCNVNG